MSFHAVLKRCSIYRGLIGLVAASLIVATGSAKSERWLKIECPSFTLMTTLDERRSVECATEFAQFFEGIRQVLAVDSRRLPPLTLVVFARKGEFNPYRLLDARGRPQEVEGYFSGFGTFWSVGCAVYSNMAEVRPTLFFNGTAWLLGGSIRRLPAWATVGLAEVFATVRVDKNGTEWGHPVGRYIDYFENSAPMRVERLLSQDTLDAAPGSVDSFQSHATAWALTHFLFFGDHGLGLNPLGTYLQQWQAGASADTATAKMLGVERDRIDKKLDDYIRSGRYRVVRRPLAPLVQLAAVPAREAEVEAVCARLAVVAGKIPLAASHVERWLKLEGQNPEAHEMAAAVSLAAGNSQAVTEAYHAAIKAGSKNPLIHFAAGDLAMREGAISFGAAARDKYREALGYYVQALTLAPESTIENYEKMATAYSRSESDVSAIRGPLDAGFARYPESGALAVSHADLMWRDGKHREARARLDEILGEYPTYPNIVTMTRWMAQKWDREVAEAASPAPAVRSSK